MRCPADPAGRAARRTAGPGPVPVPPRAPRPPARSGFGPGSGSGPWPGCRGRRGVPVTQGSAASAATPTGTLTRKTARQPSPRTSAASSQPPSSWPQTAPLPITAPVSANAWRRASPAKRVCAVRYACGTTSAVPSPCTRRAATRAPAVGARPQPSEAAVNSAVPMPKIRNAPTWSPRRPPATRPRPYTNWYPARTSCCCPSFAWSPRSMAGTATTTMNTSRLARKVPESTTASAGRLRTTPLPSLFVCDQPRRV